MVARLRPVGLRKSGWYSVRSSRAVISLLQRTSQCIGLPATLRAGKHEMPPQGWPYSRYRQARAIIMQSPQDAPRKPCCERGTEVAFAGAATGVSEKAVASVQPTLCAQVIF